MCISTDAAGRGWKSGEVSSASCNQFLVKSSSSPGSGRRLRGKLGHIQVPSLKPPKLLTGPAEVALNLDALRALRGQGEFPNDQNILSRERNIQADSGSTRREALAGDVLTTGSRA